MHNVIEVWSVKLVDVYPCYFIEYLTDQELYLIALMQPCKTHFNSVSVLDKIPNTVLITFNGHWYHSIINDYIFPDN